MLVRRNSPYSFLLTVQLVKRDRSSSLTTSACRGLSQVWSSVIWIESEHTIVSPDTELATWQLSTLFSSGLDDTEQNRTTKFGAHLEE